MKISLNSQKLIQFISAKIFPLLQFVIENMTLKIFMIHLKLFFLPSESLINFFEK